MAIGARTLEALVMPTRSGFWAGRRVLVTGHTGFKGAWLALWLQGLGAEVSGLALEPEADALFLSAHVGANMDSRITDIRDVQLMRRVVRELRPEIVFHLAARALVRESYADPVDTFAVNTQGTVHLLDAVRDADSVRVAVVVTTDKVYRNREQQRHFREDDELGGHDPYSASKAAAELAVASYRDAFLRAQGVAVASARAGNVIGGGDWAIDRLIPDAVRAWSSGTQLQVRHPRSIRPWQHVLEPLWGYLRLAERLWHQPELAGAFNIGPDTGDAASVIEVIELARTAFGKGTWECRTHDAGPHEAGHLTLDASRARDLLGLQPRWSLATAVERTMDWYRQRGEGADSRLLCLADIATYEACA